MTTTRQARLSHTLTRVMPILLALTVINIMLVTAPAANAGKWAQLACRAGDPTATEAWKASVLGGYTSQNPPQLGTIDTCLLTAGAYEARDEAGADQSAGTGPIWVYHAPTGSTIAGGWLEYSFHVPNGVAYLATPSDADIPADVLATCESPNCTESVPHDAIATIIHTGGTELFAAALCHDDVDESMCRSSGGLNAEVSIYNAEIELENHATPTGTGFTGTLLSSPVSGTANLSFTAHDANGPGVYMVTVSIDGQRVYSATPQLNGGKCTASEGVSLHGVRKFSYSQPCPQETSVLAEVSTAALADGPHQLTVEVEDAAGNLATVLDQQITLQNGPVESPPSPLTITSVLGPPPPDRGACAANPCDESAKLIKSAKEPTLFTRSLGHSATALSGRLVDPTGTPVKGAQVQLLQQVSAPSSTLTHLQTTTTNQTGQWTFKVPNGPSRLLRVAYFSHVLDPVPETTLDFHERVIAAISLHAPKHARLGRSFLFQGDLAGGFITYPQQLQMEIRYLGRWRTIDVVSTNARGQFAYRYTFTIGTGSSFSFRAVLLSNPVYPFLGSGSRPVRVAVRG
jgi:hypothetical protein